MSVLFSMSMPPVGPTAIRYPRLHTVIGAPPEVSALWAEFLLKPPSPEGYQAAIAKIENTTGRRRREAQAAGREAEASYWQTVQDDQYYLLRFWKNPQPSKTAKVGRPPIYDTREEFVEALKLATGHEMKVNRYGKKPSKEAIAHELWTTYRQLRTWEVKFGVDVNQIISSIRSPKKI